MITQSGFILPECVAFLLKKQFFQDNVTDSVSSNEVNEYSSSAITNAFQNLYAELCALLSTQDAAPESVYKFVEHFKLDICNIDST